MKKWDKEKIIKDAKKYGTRSEWKRANGSAYHLTKMYNCSEEAMAHMPTNAIKKWTKESVLEDSKKYRSRSSWQKRSSGAYDASRNLNCFKEATSHMPESISKRWDKEKILEDSKKYTTKGEWMKKSLSAYKAAQNHGCLSEATSHMPKNLQHKWTKEKIFSDALSFDCRSKWFESGSYASARLRKIDGDVSDHMVATGLWKEKPTSWTEESILEDAKKYTSRREWRESKGGYASATYYGILEKATAHMPKHVGISGGPESGTALEMPIVA